MNLFSRLFMILVYCLIEKSSGKILSEQINANLNWRFLTKFYFHPIDGYIEIKLNSRLGESGVKFFVLNKEEWKSDLSKIYLKKEFELNEEINQTNVWSLSTSFTETDKMYLVLSQCNSTANSVDISYELVLTNGKSLITKHFSDDERGILVLFIVSTSIYTIYLLIVFRHIYLLKIKSCLIIKFYLISILCSWLNILISLISTLIFALTGNKQTYLHQFLLFFAQFFYFISQILFLITLILCAKGYLITRIQLKNQILLKIKLIVLIYIIIQIMILILSTIFTNRMMINENILMICDCIQIILYVLSCFWFIVSILFTSQSAEKNLYIFLIFIIWFLANALVVLLNLLEVLPNPKITILKGIQIAVQWLTYCIFQFIIRNKTFYLQTKLNQINITYIEPTSSKHQTKEPTTSGIERNAKPNELLNLCLIENTWASRFRMPLRTSGPLPRLEPRRDTLFKSSVVSTQPSISSAPRRLAPLNHPNQ